MRRAPALETLSVEVAEAAVPAYEAALGGACGSIGLFRDETSGLWRIEGVKTRGEAEGALALALLLAAAASGVVAPLRRVATPAEGWLARTRAAFPEQRIGQHFALRGEHLRGPLAAGRITLIVDAGMAFGSGEHGSTRGCLRALERVAWRRARRVLDLGCGSGVLAMAAARLLRCRVLASDIDPWSVRVARRNVARNGLSGQVRCVRADGWRQRPVRGGGFDLVFANILARPLCGMARALSAGLAPGGIAILSGLLVSQTRMVLAAHRRQGLSLRFALREGAWATLVLQRCG